MDERRSVGETPLDRRRLLQVEAAAAATPVVVGAPAERDRGTSPAITVSGQPDPVEVTR
jgi:hypothetical protein